MPSEAELIRLWAARGVVLLQKHISELNALNVFPVADADTGTNLFLTFQSAQVAELSRTGDVDDVVDALSSLAKGAVEAARGNSGVILAEALMGVVEGLQQSPYTLSVLLRHASVRARKSVFEPQPGTILTLLDSLSELKSDNPKEITEHARNVLLQTRDLLPQLKKAGVVDAGGRGLIILLDALVQVCEGVEAESPPVGYVPIKSTESECTSDREFEVIFKTSNTDMREVQQRLHQYGVSITTSSDGVMMSVHIHTDHPKAVISDFEQDSKVWDVKIESLKPITPSVGLVAVTEGIGNAMHLAKLGVVTISEGEHQLTKADFIEGVLKCNQPEVVILVNEAYSSTARQATVDLKAFDINVISLISPSCVTTLAAAAVYDAQTENEKNYAAMKSAIRDVETLILQGEDFQALSAEKLRGIELVTIVWGAQADSFYQTVVLKHVRESAPHAEIIEIVGDQFSSLAQVGLE